MKLTRLDSLMIESPIKPLDTALVVKNHLTDEKITLIREEFEAEYLKFKQKQIQPVLDPRNELDNDPSSLIDLLNVVKTDNKKRHDYRDFLVNQLHVYRLMNAANEVVDGVTS